MIIDVRIESSYQDPLEDSEDAMSATFDAEERDEVDSQTVEVPVVTLTIETATDPPGFFGNDDEWQAWADENIKPFLKHARHNDTINFYEASIDSIDDNSAAVIEEFEHLLSRSFEWAWEPDGEEEA